MNRRGFLQALFALPVAAAPLLVPAAVAAKTGYVAIDTAHFRESMPRTYAGRLEYIADLVDAGFIDRKGAAHLLRTTFPELAWGS
jgi:hypothetical protein